MPSSARKRSQFSSTNGSASESRQRLADGGAKQKGRKTTSGSTSISPSSPGGEFPPFLRVMNVLVGLLALGVVGYGHQRYVYQIHENAMWFTNIKEVEREISFRTETGLYYSYYKQLVDTPSFIQGVRDLTSDKLTEHPDSINVLERMNIYQEVVLAWVHRAFGIQTEPILFYVHFVFGLHGWLVAAMGVFAWALSGNWLSGVLAGLFYIYNLQDTSRVSSSIALRESFSLPFLWVQAAALALYLKPRMGNLWKNLSLTTVFLSTFAFNLFWQFNQFIMMLQSFSLFGVWVLGLVSRHKVRPILLCQLASLLAVCFLQFGNKMLVGSLAMSFIISFLGLISLVGDKQASSFFRNVFRVIALIFVVLFSMVALSSLIKISLKVDSDEHIFKFLQNKFGVGDERDFDSRLYLCLGIFGFVTWDVFTRMASTLALPLYLPAHLAMVALLVYAVIQRWRAKSPKSNTCDSTKGAGDGHTMMPPGKGENLMDRRPDLAFHTIQAIFFGALAMITLRMKYFWTPYVCVFAAVGIADERLWELLASLLKIQSRNMVTLAKSSVLVLVIAIVASELYPSIQEDLAKKTEFWDPDTVELMEWIVNKTAPLASFTGSMQLLAGVKLCTGRPITNHPHYEDKYLRHKTKELYQIYGRRKPEDVHAILRRYDSNYIILEDSICRAPSQGGCRTPDVVDIDNGVMPDQQLPIPGLVKSVVPRFCEEVRNQRKNYSKYFKTVFVNRTFRIYQVLQ